MGYFKEKLIEQMGHDLDNPFRFLYAQARKAEKATEHANWWKAESNHDSDLQSELQKELNSNSKMIYHDVSA